MNKEEYIPPFAVFENFVFDMRKITSVAIDRSSGCCVKVLFSNGHVITWDGQDNASKIIDKYSAWCRQENEFEIEEQF